MTTLSYKVYRNKNLDEGISIIISNRLYTPSTGAIRDRVKRKLCDLIIISFFDNCPVGCIIRDNCTSDIVINEILEKRYIINTWVKPSFRGRKIGTFLISTMKKHSRKKLAGYGSVAGLNFYPKTNIPFIAYL